MAGETDDDAIYPVTGNEDLTAARLPPEHDDDGRDAYALFGNDVGSWHVSIYLDDDAAGAATITTTETTVASNTHNTSDTPSSAGAASGKHKFKFDLNLKIWL